MVLEKRYHLPCKLVRILKSLHERTRGAVRAYGKVSSEFDVTTGVRQGDVLAPVLFNLFLDAVIAATISKHPRSGIRMLYDLDGPLVGNRKKMRRSVSVRDLEYADDMALVCDSMDALEEILRALDASCLGMGLAINPKKTKIMVVHPTSSSSTTLRPVLVGAGREPIEVVEDFEYLGSTIAQDCLLDREIDRQISKAAHAFRSLYRVLWCRKSVKVVTKLRLFRVVVLATLLYGSETWVPLAAHMKRLQAFIMGCLRVILGVTRWDMKRNTMLRSLGEMERVETMIMKRRLRWLGHLERMENSRIPKCFLVCRPVTGRRSAGGQKKRWCDVLVSDLKWCDMWDDWRKIAKDRGAWRCLVREAASDFNDHKEAHEKERKDERKKRREEGTQPAALDWKCDEPGCVFVGQTKAGLVNHVRQRHSSMAMVMERCAFCDEAFHKQGITMHSRYCEANPNRKMSRAR